MQYHLIIISVAMHDMDIFSADKNNYPVLMADTNKIND